MSESIADRFVYAAAKVREIDEGVDNDNPHRYPIRRMKELAEKILSDAISSALDLANSANILKDEVRNMDARNQP